MPWVLAQRAGGHSSGGSNGGTCFEEDCRTSPYLMHFSATSNTTAGTRVCFKFVAIGCYASGGKGCCVQVARRLQRIEFLTSE